ncbi:GNAT family N-acetyltransferase [Bacillus infantis]|uniref:GNAT family N-acetyltransferase n=1 Tax=Bacillus infantis TaxID=324767 RepID=UPI001CD58F14|nr:GNAT family N-acetyltransferase [Bacillus infantis]MCA1041972.1 GNAT family N-acetyltransferase [Bacillus infantis]
MDLRYEVLPAEESVKCRDLCNELMVFQKSKALMRPEMFDSMNYETRMVPSIRKAASNYIVLATDDGKPAGYVYSNVSPKEVYSNEFAVFFDPGSIKSPVVGCLSQFYIKEEYRKLGIGSRLFAMSMEWLEQFEEVEDYFIYVSNGNQDALEFYQRKGFPVSHEILDGFITVLHRKK